MGRVILAVGFAICIAACAPNSQSAGLEVAKDAGCVACHTAVDTDLAPSWIDLWGSEVELDDGSTVLADEAYIRRSIEDPDAQVVSGYRPTMPLIPLSAEEKSQLISYIGSLG